MKTFVIKLILCLLLVAAAGEILIRISLPNLQPRNTLDRTSDHPYIRKEWIPGFSANYNIGNLGQKEPVHFQINAFSFRSSAMKTSVKPAGTARIFFLGESTTESLTLEEEQTFPGIVEQGINSALAPTRFECINAAMSGNLTADSLVTLIYKVMYYEPDIIIVMHAINDLRYGTVPSFNPLTRTDFNRSFYFAGYSEEGGNKGLIRSLCKKSYLLALLKRNLTDRLSLRSIQSKWDSMVRKRKKTPVSEIQESKSLNDFLKNLKEMVFIARGHKVRIILMTEPSIYQNNIPQKIDNKLWMGYLPNPGINLSNEFLYREMRRFNDAVRNLRVEDGIEVIDLDNEIPKTLDYFYDDVHLTAKGAAKAGKVIADYLINGPMQSL